MEINVHEAKTQLSRLLRRVSDGEEVIISRAGVPVAKLVAVSCIANRRPLGAMEGQIYIAEDFDAPLPADLLASFYGEEPRRKEPARVKGNKNGRKQAPR
ncbi:MAG TPA: type II toxin-antitoxin system prevent-host-death family antitoxin [Terriglobales bacterium]|nr:type II toxin-antitoxin system prevent-host-death family antitoxin [Terriglobales bacterium]